MKEDYTKIIIKNLKLDMFIGIHDHEKANKQQVIVSVEANIKSNAAWKADLIQSTLNYELTVSAVKEIAGRGHINLVETFAENIAEFCLTDPMIKNVKVTVEKPDIYDFIDSVAVEIFRNNS